MTLTFNKHPKPENEKDRLRALDDYGILDTAAETAFDRITALASIICDAPISLVSLIDENRQWFKSKHGIDLNETSRDLAFCQYAIMDTDIFEVEDASLDERFKENPFVIENPKIRFYAGSPLIDPDGFALGTLCVIDSKPKVLSAVQKQALKLLTEQVIGLILERRQKQELKNFERIFEKSNDLICIAGTDGFFRKINPAFERLFNYPREYFTETSYFDMVHPDDREITEQEVYKLSEGYDSVNFVHRFKTNTEDYKTIQWTAATEPSSGLIYAIGRDITEQEVLKKKLIDNEEKLRTFFEHSQGLMCSHDMNGRFLSVNEAGASLLGYTTSEILNLSLFDIVPVTRHSFLIKYLLDVEQNGAVKGQMVTQHKNGSYRIWLYDNILENTPDSNPYIIGNAIDITEKHHLELDLKRTKDMLEQTNEVARVGGWESDLVNNKSTWTKAIYDIFEVDHDFDRDSAQTLALFKDSSKDKLVAAIENTIAHGSKWDLQLQLKKRDKWVRSVGEPIFNDQNEITTLKGMFIDVDDFKLAELALKSSVETQELLNQQLLDKIEVIKKQDQTIEMIREFKFLADSIPQIVWTAKPDGNLDYYNQHWFNFTGMTLEQTIDWGWEPVLHPDDLENCINVWTECFTTGKPYEIEYRFKRASDNTYRWHLGRALPMRNEKGEIVKWFGSCTDIDEYKKALDLENKISQYEDFNRIVAHNLRGPAGSISLLLAMMQEAKSETEKEELIEMLNQSSVTMNDTLDGLMKVLELRHNKNLTYDDCNLEELVIKIKAMLSGQIATKNAIITTDLKIATVKFPQIYLESIFYNMISNALKYSKADVPPQITVSAFLENNQVKITFKDNGLGIDLKLHGSNMFKLNKVFHRGFDSKGVGLFMTKTQIETFGGKISVESQPNIGSTFIITL